MPSAIDASKTRDTRGRLPIHTLCTNDAVTPGMLKILLEAYPTGAIARDLDECQPLHLLCSNPAITEPHLNMLMSFAAKFAPDAMTLWAVVSKTDAWFQHPLHRLCSNLYVYPECIEAVVALHTAAVWEQDGRGWTPLQCLLRCEAQNLKNFLHVSFPSLNSKPPQELGVGRRPRRRCEEGGDQNV
jgi:hypothetical protein